MENIETSKTYLTKDEKTNSENFVDLQVRRPNRLYEKSLKKNLALLFDVLMYKFYTLNPDGEEFKISWVELQKNFGINTGNKNHIKAKLEELQKENLISSLKFCTYGFEYKFENTFLSYGEILKPTTWTLLNFSLMQKLDFVAYKIYTWAYKFFDFTKEKHHKYENQTKFLETKDFLELFNQKTPEYEFDTTSQNRLLARVRKAIEFLKTLGIEIDLITKTFGKPIVEIKMIFKKVPKLEKILKKAVDFTVQKTKRFKSIFKEKAPIKEDFKEISRQKQHMTHRDIYLIAEDHTIRNFVIEELFPAIVRSNLDFLQKSKEWIVNKFGNIETGRYDISFGDARKYVESLKESGSFKKLIENDVFEDHETKYLKVEGKGTYTEYVLRGFHPVIPKVPAYFHLLKVE